MAGLDLNRQWQEPSDDLSPTIVHVKNLLHALNEERKVLGFFMDFHGHSNQKNIFVYGCSPFRDWMNPTVVDAGETSEDEESSEGEGSRRAIDMDAEAKVSTKSVKKFSGEYFYYRVVSAGICIDNAKIFKNAVSAELSV